MIRRTLAMLALAGMLIGCDAWEKPPSQTSCAEWLDDMDRTDRSIMASMMLGSLWERDGAATTPDATVSDRYANAIGQVCASARTDTVASVAAGLYLLSDDLKPVAN